MTAIRPRLAPAQINQPEKNDPSEQNAALVKRKGGGGGGVRGGSGGGGGGRTGSSGISGPPKSGGSSSGSNGTPKSGGSGSNGTPKSGGSGSNGTPKSGGSGSNGTPKSGGSGSSGNRVPALPYKAPGYRPATHGIASGNRGSIFGAGNRQPTLVTGSTFGGPLGYPYCYGGWRRGCAVPPSFWEPVYYLPDAQWPNRPAGVTGRPGGPLLTVTLAPNGTTATNGANAGNLIFTADTDSVDAVILAMEACGLVKVTTPSDAILKNNVTVQTYRWDSAVLAQLTNGAPNGTFVPNNPYISCVNDSIGANLPVDQGAGPGDGMGTALAPHTGQVGLAVLGVVLYQMFS